MWLRLHLSLHFGSLAAILLKAISMIIECLEVPIVLETLYNGASLHGFCDVLEQNADLSGSLKVVHH